LNGSLRAHDRAADQTLGTMFAACDTGDDMAIGSRGGAIHIKSRAGDHCVAHVLPLTSGARRATAATHRAAAAVFWPRRIVSRSANSAC
jgi:hypothetical protein